jgi:hypothetical protein
MEAEYLLERRCGHPLPMPASFFPDAKFPDDVGMLVSRQVQVRGIAMPGLRLGVDYLDANGNKSRRSIRVFRLVKQEFGYHIFGVCELRHEFRLFRSDRMSELIDWRTGEIVADPTLYLDELAQAAIATGVDIWETINSGITVLTAMVAIDRVIYDEEVEAVIAFVSEAALESGVAVGDETVSQIRQAVLSACPTVEMVRQALRQVKTFPSVARLLKRAIRDVIERDDSITEEEQIVAAHFIRLLDS